MQERLLIVQYKLVYLRSREVNDMKFLNQDCDLTLQQGLNELYENNPQVAAVSLARGKLFTDHDLTHVIFGYDTSLDGEIGLKPWILLGCNITMAELKAYAADPEIERLREEGIEMMGGVFMGTLKYVFQYLPEFVWTWLTRVRRMSKQWPHSAVTGEMLETKLCDLRREYNIRLVPKKGNTKEPLEA